MASTLQYPSSLRINVLKNDISRGLKCDCLKCPLAMAAKRAIEEAMGRKMPRGHELSVTKQDIEVYRYGRLNGVRIWFTLQIYEMESEGRQFIEEFDGGLPVDPFTMTVKAIPGKAGAYCVA